MIKKETMNETNIIEIKPENASPKGFLKFAYYFCLAFGLITFPFGGFFFFFLGVWALFINPKNVKKKYQVSYILSPDKFTAYRSGGRICWSIPWTDIDSIYTISYNWMIPKSLGLRLNNYQNLQESIEENKSNYSNSIFNKFAFFSFNKNMLRLSKLLAKHEITLPYVTLDRPADDFAQLLFLYIENANYNS